jgi:hypothetical protein
MRIFLCGFNNNRISREAGTFLHTGDHSSSDGKSDNASCSQKESSVIPYCWHADANSGMGPTNRISLSITATVILAGGVAGAQNLTTSVAEAYQPRFQDNQLFLDPDFKGSVSSNLRVKATYDSNLTLDEDRPKSDLVLALSPSLAYRSDPEGGAKFSLEAGYTPEMKTYLKDSDLNSFDQAASAVLKYVGAKTLLSTYVNYREISGPDRFAEGFVDGSSISYGLSGSYQVAPRTSISANFRGSKSTYKTQQEGADSYSTTLSGNWAYSERLSFGPSLSYSNQKSELTGTHQSYSLAAQARYTLDERLNFSGTFGIESTKDSRLSGKGARLGFTGDLTASYAIGNRWNWTSSIRYATLPSPSAQNYIIHDLTFSTGLTRELNRGTVGAAIDWSSSKYEQVGPAPGIREDSTFTSFALSYNRGIFNERATLDSSARYSFNKGDRDYSQLQLSVSVNFKF